MSEQDQRISDLYQASKERLLPPAELDRTIRATARRYNRATRWLPLGAVGAAATLLIGVGLAWFYVGVPPALLPQPAPSETPTMDIHTDAPAAAPPSAEPEPRAGAPQPSSILLEIAAPPKAVAIEEKRTSRGRDAELHEDAAASGMAVQQVTEPVCMHDLANAPAGAWLATIDAARAAGDRQTADCLAAAYRERFGDDPPGD